MLTNVGLEHTRWLGPTIADIASEKLAVVREGSTLVIGPDLHPDALALARSAPAKLVRRAGDGNRPRRARRLPAAQLRAGRAAAEALVGELDPDAVLAAAAVDTRSGPLRGRRRVIRRPCSTGRTTPRAWPRWPNRCPRWLDGRELVAVVSILDDKDAAAMLKALIPHCRAHRVHDATPTRGRCLRRRCSRWPGSSASPPVSAERDPRTALAVARRVSGPGGAVLVTGSIYLIADLLRPGGSAGEPRCERRITLGPAA